MPVLKIIKNKDFVTMTNILAQNPDMSYEAKGLLLELLSRPNDWKIKKEQFIRKHAGETKITRIFKELQEKNYVYLCTILTGDGKRIKTRKWFINYEKIFGCPAEMSLPELIIKVDGIFKEQTGIYFLYKDNIIVYIGQTHKGISRVFEHIKEKDFDAYSFLPSNKDELDILECKYIRNLKPRYNKSSESSNRN